jgi:hypothetical protein
MPITPSDPDSTEHSLLGEPIPIASPYNSTVLLQAIMDQLEADEAASIADALATHFHASSVSSTLDLPASPPTHTEPPSPVSEHSIPILVPSPATSITSYWNPDEARPTFDALPFDYLVQVIREIRRPSSHAPHYYACPYSACRDALSTLDQLQPDFLQFVVNPINNVHLDQATHMV